MVTATSADGGFSASCTVRVSELGYLGEAMNAEGGALQFSYSRNFPWVATEVDGRTVGVSSFFVNSSFESEVYTYVYLEEGDIITFDNFIDAEITAAEYYNGYVYGFTTDNRFFSASFDNMSDYTLAETATSALTGKTLVGIAYNYADSTMYVLAQTNETTCAIGTLNLGAGKINFPMSDIIEISGAASWAIDDNRIAYCMLSDFSSVVFDLDNISPGVTAVYGALPMFGAGSNYIILSNLALRFDHEEDMLYCALYASGWTMASGVVRLDPSSDTLEVLGIIEYAVGSSGSNADRLYDIERMFIPYDLPTVLLGDVDEDGQLSATDALLVLRYCIDIAGLSEEGLPLADYNSDGAIDLADALLLLRTCIG